MEPRRLKRLRPTEVSRPRCLACHATSHLTPTMDGAAFVCRLARCRDTWLAQRQRRQPAGSAAEPTSLAAKDATTEPFEAFRRRPDAAPATE